MKFYFRFSFWPFRRHRYVILHLPTKFHPNWTFEDEVMMIYQFSKMAATTSQIYFWFRVWWRRTFKKVKNYVRTNFDEISQSMADIVLLPFSQNRRSPHWNSISSFDFDLFVMWFCMYQISHKSDHPRQRCDVITIFKMSDVSHFGSVGHHRSVIDGPCSVLTFRLDLICSYRDNASFIFWNFGLKLPIHVHFYGFWGIFPVNDTIRRSNPPKDSPCTETRRLSHKASNFIH